MINQYTNSYGSISTDIQNIVANDIGLLDDYILFQSGQYEYTALIKTKGTGQSRKIVISRSGLNNSYYSVSRSSADFECNISNEYYVYSNIGYGKSLDLPVYEGLQTFSLCIIAGVLSFAIVFKGVLFKCLKRRKKSF